MFRASLICVGLLFAFSLAKRETLKISPEKAVTVANEMIQCANEEGTDMVTMMDQLMSWKITDANKAKRFLYCFTTKHGLADKEGKLLSSKILELTGDFKSKDKLINVIDDCNAKSSGKNAMDKLFSAGECFQKNSPVLYTI